MSNEVALTIIYAPGILFGVILLISCLKEPRQFRNAIWFLLFVMSLSAAALMQFGQEWMLVPVVLVALFGPVVAVIFLIVNAFVVIRHEGLSVATLLPLAMALAIIGWFVLYPVLIFARAPRLLFSVASLITTEGVWFFFSFVALLLYSTLYRLLPRRRTYDYIVIHGAGLMPDGSPTPLLRGRIDKAFKLWERQGRAGKFIASGGQGSDEAVSEAAAIRQYLLEAHDVPDDAVIEENQSTTTMENLQFSKDIMDRLSGPGTYRCALVTSDYHVFRASEYAHGIGLKADGVGSHTRGYYWPTAFIREFIAVTRAHLWPYIVIAVLWAIPIAIELVVMVLRFIMALH